MAAVGDKIKIIGFPGEYDRELYEMCGTIKEIRERKDGKLILYDDLDTSEGQSGSPIYLERDGKWRIIGVHVGYDKRLKCNIGTALTYDKFIRFMN